MGQIWYLSTKYKHSLFHKTENTRTYILMVIISGDFNVLMVIISGDFNLDVDELVIAHRCSISSCQAK